MAMELSYPEGEAFEPSESSPSSGFYFDDDLEQLREQLGDGALSLTQSSTYSTTGSSPSLMELLSASFHNGGSGPPRLLNPEPPFLPEPSSDALRLLQPPLLSPDSPSASITESQLKTRVLLDRLARETPAPQLYTIVYDPLVPSATPDPSKQLFMRLSNTLDIIQGPSLPPVPLADAKTPSCAQRSKSSTPVTDAHSDGNTLTRRSNNASTATQTLITACVAGASPALPLGPVDRMVMSTPQLFTLPAVALACTRPLPTLQFLRHTRHDRLQRSSRRYHSMGSSLDRSPQTVLPACSAQPHSQLQPQRHDNSAPNPLSPSQRRQANRMSGGSGRPPLSPRFQPRHLSVDSRCERNQRQQQPVAAAQASPSKSNAQQDSQTSQSSSGVSSAQCTPSQSDTQLCHVQSSCGACGQLEPDSMVNLSRAPARAECGSSESTPTEQRLGALASDPTERLEVMSEPCLRAPLIGCSSGTADAERLVVGGAPRKSVRFNERVQIHAVTPPRLSPAHHSISASEVLDCSERQMRADAPSGATPSGSGAISPLARRSCSIPHLVELQMEYPPAQFSLVPASPLALATAAARQFSPLAYGSLETVAVTAGTAPASGSQINQVLLFRYSSLILDLQTSLDLLLKHFDLTRMLFPASSDSGERRSGALVIPPNFDLSVIDRNLVKLLLDYLLPSLSELLADDLRALRQRETDSASASVGSVASASRDLSFGFVFGSRAHQLSAPHALWRALGQLLLACFPSSSRARFIPIYNQVEASSTPTYAACSTDSEYTSTTIRLIKFLLVVFNAQKLDYFLALLLMQLDLGALATYYSDSSCLYFSNAYFQARYQNLLPPILAAKGPGASALSISTQHQALSAPVAQFTFPQAGRESLLEPSDLFGPLEHRLLLLASANVQSMGPLDVENAIQSFLDGQDIKRRLLGHQALPHALVSSPPPPPPPPHATNLQPLSKTAQHAVSLTVPSQQSLVHIGAAAASVASGSANVSNRPPNPNPNSNPMLIRQVRVSNGSGLSATSPSSLSPAPGAQHSPGALALNMSGIRFYKTPPNSCATGIPRPAAAAAERLSDLPAAVTASVERSSSCSSSTASSSIAGPVSASSSGITPPLQQMHTVQSPPPVSTRPHAPPSAGNSSSRAHAAIGKPRALPLVPPPVPPKPRTHQHHVAPMAPTAASQMRASKEAGNGNASSSGGVRNREREQQPAWNSSSKPAAGSHIPLPRSGVSSTGTSNTSPPRASGSSGVKTTSSSKQQPATPTTPSTPGSGSPGGPLSPKHEPHASASGKFWHRLIKKFV